MLILGIDSSSTKSGVAVIKDGKVTEVSVFYSNKKDDLGKRLYDWGEYLRNTKAKRRIDAIGLEQVSSSRNLNTVRMLAYFEAVVIQKSAEWDTKLFLFKPATARKIALGNGSITKEQVYDKFKKKYGLLPYSNGGNDQSDSIVIALATQKSI